jgi:hypothetical protein
MNFTLRLVFAAAFLSIVLDGSAAHAQNRRRPQRRGVNNSARTAQMMRMFQANQQRNWAMLQSGRAPVYRSIPNASPSPRYTPLPNPATSGLNASFYGTLALNQLATGNLRQGATSGAKSLYNAHNAAAGYSARTLPPSGPTGYLTLGQQGIPVHHGYAWDEHAKKSAR